MIDTTLSAFVPLGIDVLQLGVLVGIFRRLGQHTAAIKSLRARLTMLEERANADAERAD